MSNVPTAEEVRKQFEDFCIGRECDQCKYHIAGKFNMCRCCAAFTIDVVKNALKSTEEAKSPTSTKRSDKLPNWCKEGSWVFCDGNLLGQIKGFEEISEEGSTSPTKYVVLRSYDTLNELQFTRLPRKIKPVRFRGYSFEEARGLLGKVMDYSCDNGPFSGRTEKSLLITEVSNGKYGVLINGNYLRDLSQLFNATINGIPIGVPVVDEEALKGGEE